jgi:hypothetical protein
MSSDASNLYSFLPGKLTIHGRNYAFVVKILIVIAIKPARYGEGVRLTHLINEMEKIISPDIFKFYIQPDNAL